MSEDGPVDEVAVRVERKLLNAIDEYLTLREDNPMGLLRLLLPYTAYTLAEVIRHGNMLPASMDAVIDKACETLRTATVRAVQRKDEAEDPA